MLAICELFAIMTTFADCETVSARISEVLKLPPETLKFSEPAVPDFIKNWPVELEAVTKGLEAEQSLADEMIKLFGIPFPFMVLLKKVMTVSLVTGEALPH